MINAADQIRNEIKKLTSQGINLFNAMQTEQHSDCIKEHFEKC